MSENEDTILVCADKDNTVNETDEGNNCMENVFTGDVSENCEVALYDSLYLGNYLFEKPGFETMNEGVGEVSGYGNVTPL